MSYPDGLVPMGRFSPLRYREADTRATPEQAFPPNALHGTLTLSVLLAGMYSADLHLITN